ncbi:MAG: HAMP domain-containing histidine kinase [Planctomycetes bacterium]|nr:HAMP domain-containing histidine kinase [Planctomycetota bacterium]
MSTNADRPAAEQPGPDGYSSEAVRRHIRRIESGLTRVLFGDYTAVVSLEDADPMWGNLAMHVNVVINAARNAIARAEASEREAALARDRAIAAAEAESRFLTNVTHELRTPMASIKASAEILRDYGKADPAVLDEFLGVMISESDRLTRLIENVLTLGRLQADETRWTLVEGRVEDVVEEVVNSLRPLAISLGTYLQNSVAGESPTTLMDRDGLLQVVVNVVSNALKFSPGQSVVETLVRFDSVADEIVIEVRDEGPGIPASELESIFERFRQVTPDILTQKPSGTGLGLAIAKEIVDHHGGRISAESELGKGSLFRIALPVIRDPADFGAARRAAPVEAD